MTFKNLTAGMVVSFYSLTNEASEFVVLSSTADRFGTWVKVENKETNHVEMMPGRTELGFRWKVANAA